MDINEIRIQVPNQKIYEQVRYNWDHVAKPLDGLGQFETIIAQIGAIQETTNVCVNKKAVIVMCADNGIVKEGISQSGQEVTSIITKCMGKKESSVCKMASLIGANVLPIDIGINTKKVFPGVINKKIAYGTKNFTECEAMEESQALLAIQTGIDLVKKCKEEGYQLIGTGEMGIGNTTTSSAMTASFLIQKSMEGNSVSDTEIRQIVKNVTGRGAGLDDAGLVRKRQVIYDAVTSYQLAYATPLKILCSVGGLDIAGLTGVFLGGAIHHVPIVIDGVISLVAALTAQKLVPGAKDYMIPSHKSKEPAAEWMMKELSLNPVIDAKLALGEGTGAVMMFALLDMAMALYQSETTFDTVAIKPYERLS